jgi:phage terminase Nu1 subunit (DNA packaging protein)
VNLSDLASIAAAAAVGIVVFLIINELAARTVYGPRLRRWHLEHQLKFLTQYSQEAEALRTRVQALELDGIRLRSELTLAKTDAATVQRQLREARRSA